MSSVVAVAGGTGTLGRAIVEGLVDARTFKVIVLTREASEETSKELGAHVVQVDYTDKDSIVALLESNKVDTLVSTLGARAGGGPETTLIEAADESCTTRRYIASDWGADLPPETVAILPYVQLRIDALKALEKSSLEYTSVLNGLFLDYYVAPHVKSYMDSRGIIIDLPANAAAIPGSGDVPVVFTYSLDIARFAAALLKLPKWEKQSYVIGDKLTWNQFLHICEEAKGTKFDVVYDSVEKLERGEITELPSHRSYYSTYGKEVFQKIMSGISLLSERGYFNLEPQQRTLNEIFPEIKPYSVKELVKKAWTKQ